MENSPHIGQLITNGDRRRDAVHIAVAPVTADAPLLPGQHVGLTRSDEFEYAGPCERNIGIVDPFLTEPVAPGQRFWLFLYPGTITSLRHIWSHPEFSSVAQSIKTRLP